MPAVPYRAFVLALGGTAVAFAAFAGKPVYKDVDDRGRTVYSDRPTQGSSKPIRDRIPPDPGAAGYDAAQNRAESDRLTLQGVRLENLQPRRVATYDPPPGYAQHRPASPVQFRPDYAPRSRWDPSLPPSPSPSLDRNYYYNGR
jgi:hypothetical protein